MGINVVPLELVSGGTKETAVILGGSPGYNIRLGEGKFSKQWIKNQNLTIVSFVIRNYIEI